MSDIIPSESSSGNPSFVRPNDLSPIPKVAKTNRKRVEQSEIITFSPYKQKLVDNASNPNKTKKGKTTNDIKKRRE